MNIGFYGLGLASLVGIWVGLGLDIQRSRERFKLNRQMKLATYNQTWIKNPLVKHYHFLLSACFKKYQLSMLSRIIVMQATLFIFTTLMLFVLIQEFLFAIAAAAVLIIVVPVGILYMIHKQRQFVLQSELTEASIMLLQQYQKNHYHMIFALKAVSEEMSGWPQVVYAQLFARMHDDDEKKELAAENFAFQVGYVRGKNLASIILRACKDGTQVMVALQDLIEDLTEFNKRIRNAETEASEAASIGYSALPLLIVLHVFNEWKLMPGEAFYYQFQTAQGLKSFIIAFIFSLVGIALAIIVKKPKKM